MDMLQVKILFQVKICQPRLILSFLSFLLAESWFMNNQG